MSDGRTNILLIETDQWNAACLSLLGNPNVRTPNLDRLAREGILFTHATCQSPICMPSRVSMLSGQYPTRNRQFGFTGVCDRGVPWLPKTLKEAGYRTAAIGKFHTLCIEDEDWGFDIAAATLPEDYDLARPSDYTYMHYCRQAGIPWPTDQMHGHNPYGDGPKPSAQANENMTLFQRQSCQSDVPLEHSLETWTTNQCLHFLRGSKHSAQPFFIWLTYDRPHHPTSLPREWHEKIRPDELVLPKVAPPEAIAKLPYTSFMGPASFPGASLYSSDESSFRFVLATYYTLIEWIDSEIGRVMDELKRLGLDDNTTILFTSDHGDEAGYHGLYTKGSGCLSDALTRVPLIIRPARALGPDVKQHVREEPVELVDLFPTLCAVGGVSRPKEVEGVDLSGAVLRGDKLDADRLVYCEELFRRMITRRGMRLSFDAIRADECALFDLRADPDCFWNLYEEPRTQATRIELKRDLLAFLLQRIHGDCTAADVARLRRCLEPGSERLGLHVPPFKDRVHCFRAAAVIRHLDHDLIVPFAEDPMLLFRGTCDYKKSNQADPFVPSIAEAMLDWALRDCIHRVHPISVTVSTPLNGRRATLGEARAFLARGRVNSTQEPGCQQSTKPRT